MVQLVDLRVDELARRHDDRRGGSRCRHRNGDDGHGRRGDGLGRDIRRNVQNGQQCRDYARKGQEVELKAKLLVIDEIELLSFDSSIMHAVIRVVCSKGTYIRALARDIGQKLESGAYLTDLRRTRVGNIKVEQCLSISDLDTLFEHIDNNN